MSTESGVADTCPLIEKRVRAKPVGRSRRQKGSISHFSFLIFYNFPLLMLQLSEMQNGK
jgi:hypothetical protein